MNCPKCKGFLTPSTMNDDSFNFVGVNKCLNCGFVNYPNHTPIPLSYNPIKGGRKGIPMMFRRKENKNV